MLHAWRREAEQDLHDAAALAACGHPAGPGPCVNVLTSYAFVLRKNHHGKEAWFEDKQIAVLSAARLPAAAIYVTELIPKPKPRKK